MPYLIFIILLILFYIWFKRILENGLRQDILIRQQLKQQYADLLKKETVLALDNKSLQDVAESIIELYEITKDVCKSIEKDVVFDIFKEKLKHYIGIERVQLTKEDNIDYGFYKDKLIFPLDIGIRPTYFLVAEGVPTRDEEKFYILAQQFLLGLRRGVLYRKIQDLAIHDSLTSLLSRRYFLERLSEEIKRSEKFNLHFSFLMIDVDHFKGCNDRYGHLVGDVALKEIAQVLKENTRQIDIAGRYGGEEFSIVLSETPKEGALIASERIRKSIETKKIRAYDEELNLTISIGISGFPEDGKHTGEIIDKSDSALYRAKETGRNRICIYGLFK